MDYLSEKIKEYRDIIKILRTSLNYTLKSSILEEDFYKNLNYAKSLEREILEDILPLYREKEKHKADISLYKYSLQGSYIERGFIENIISVREDIYLLSSSKQNTRFLLLDRENKTYEFTDILKEVDDRVVYFKKYNKIIYIFTVLGKIYALNTENIDKFIYYGEKLDIKELDKDSDIYGFETLMEIDKNKFISIEEDRVELFILEKNRLNYKKDIYLNIDNPKALKKLSHAKFLIGDIKGNVYLVGYKDGNFIVEDKLNLVEGEILYIDIYSLENDRKIAFISTVNNYLYLVDIDKFKILKKFDFDGNIYKTFHNKNSLIALSDTGKIYLFEENLKAINLNKNRELSNKFISSGSSLADNRDYLLFDIDGNLNILKVNRLEDIEDLRKISLYD